MDYLRPIYPKDRPLLYSHKDLTLLHRYRLNIQHNDNKGIRQFPLLEGQEKVVENKMT
jgi:hypothetical protein